MMASHLCVRQGAPGVIDDTRLTMMRLDRPRLGLLAHPARPSHSLLLFSATRPIALSAPPSPHVHRSCSPFASGARSHRTHPSHRAPPANPDARSSRAWALAIPITVSHPYTQAAISAARLQSIAAQKSHACREPSLTQPI
ncbi:hypothetical protein C8T65DRAFT_26711 [Cerioporus squamosus]|nr:hypothetical protein C8T65DRAFT_26711 [Cerioporus squamosus]